jgi:hypothetical protein
LELLLQEEDRGTARASCTDALRATRVVIWRTSEGVHIAPHGAAVSAIALSAVLVTLDPNVDLDAWLGGR